MIVSRTIKGNDVFPRFPQGRVISERAPQNNPNQTESRITLHTTQTPRLMFCLQQLLLIFIDLTRHFLPLDHQPHSCLKISLWSNLKTIISLHLSHYPTPLISPPASHPLHTAATLTVECFFLRFLVKLPTVCVALTRAAPVFGFFYATVTQCQASSCFLHFLQVPSTSLGAFFTAHLPKTDRLLHPAPQRWRCFSLQALKISPGCSTFLGFC